MNERRMKTREELIAEGRPYIKYEKDGKVWTQIFLTRDGMETRVQELTKAGYSVTIIQK